MEAEKEHEKMNALERLIKKWEYWQKERPNDVFSPKLFISDLKYLNNYYTIKTKRKAREEERDAQ